MKLFPNTLRRQISLVIALMGCIGMLMVVAILKFAWHQILEHEQDSFRELLKNETVTLQNAHNELLEEFGIRIQKNPELKTAIKSKDKEALKEIINSEFHQYYITTGVLVINKIFILDRDYRLIVESTDGKNNNLTYPVCAKQIKNAKTRVGVLKSKVLIDVCYQGGRSYKTTIIPINTLKPIGYLQIVSEPENLLIKAEEKLGLPIKVLAKNKELIHQSPKWPKSNEKAEYIFVDHPIIGMDEKPEMYISVARNISLLNESFTSSQIFIFIGAGLITLLSISIFILIFERSMLKPLSTLTRQLILIEEDKSLLYKELDVSGSSEIRLLIEKFNKLSGKLAKSYQSLEDLAFNDQLTALPNRSRLQETLSFYTSVNQQNDKPFALFMMDLDRFKAVNDTLGHHAGDILLQQVGQRLTSVLRKSDHLSLITVSDVESYHIDFVARLGGDEFAAVLPNISNQQESELVAGKILQAMKESFVIEGYNFSVGISIGIALCPLHGSNEELLMQHADVAMYQAKVKQNGYAIYDSRKDQHSLNTLLLDADLREAINNDLLELYYQPKIKLKTRTVIGVEALIRWNHEKLGFIPPDKFIPIAEQTGLINYLTHWVLKTAIKQKAQWKNLKFPLSISINLSAKNLLDTQLINKIRHELSEHDVKANQIYLELTETAVMQDPVHAITVLRELYDMGVRISIDDFGTGYSSLSYLKRLPIDEIKIDRSFVMDMEQDINDAVIVQSTIDLAHNMGLRVVAEGVENLSILEKLDQKKCDYAQGYYIAKPLCNNDLIDWIKSSEWTQ